MDYQKGFSLIEVLISLMLMSTLAFCLLEQQGNMRAYVNTLNLQAGATDFLDEVSEVLYLDTRILPKAPEVYHFHIQYQPAFWELYIAWHHEVVSLSRQIIV